jgi:gamma-glutamyltranspeptidase/glutathione hydrolase
MRAHFMFATAFVFLITTPPRPADDLGVAGKDGLVVCTSSAACDAGASVLARGGNAVDAAVATAFALAVTHPSAGNIGGGGFMIVRTPTGNVTTFDYRERAPLRSTRTMYLGNDGQIVRQLTNTGYLAPGVPGTVRGLELAHKRFGKLPWKEVVMPAVRLAEEGFILAPGLARDLNTQVAGPMKPFPASVATYGKPGGGEWAAGDRLVLTDLGKTLRAIAEAGADVFYKGWIADRIADDMKAHEGLITKKDLASYRARVRKPVTGKYRDFEIISMPPPSSGGVALIEMLNILEPYQLKQRGLLTAPALHLQVEAMRRAYLDRARDLGDPDFVKVPVAELTSKTHAKQVSATIDPDKASSSIELGRDIVSTASSTSHESDETTHFSVIDRSGMSVASTYTLEGGFGSHVVVAGAGFILNNEMGDFNKKPGETNVRGDIGTPANLIDPGKRMLSSMTPTMVTKNGKLVLVTGSPGGRTIINTVFTIVFGVVEYGLTGRQAVDLPRLNHEWLPDTAQIERDGAPSEDVFTALTGMGHSIRPGSRQGDAESIWIAPDGTPYGVNDKRSVDSKASSAADLTAPTAGR